MCRIYISPSITHNVSTALWFIFFIVIRYLWQWHVEPFAHFIRSVCLCVCVWLHISTAYQSWHIDQCSPCQHWGARSRWSLCIDLLSRSRYVCDLPKVCWHHVPFTWVSRFRKWSVLSNLCFSLATISFYHRHNYRTNRYVRVGARTLCESEIILQYHYA